MKYKRSKKLIKNCVKGEGKRVKLQLTSTRIINQQSINEKRQKYKTKFTRKATEII